MARILSLDDEPQMIELMRLILQAAGFEFLGTTNEQEALSILRTQPIDLFTQDFMRPGPGGCEFLRHMKSDDTLRSIPVLAVTAGSREMRTEQLKQVGLDIDRDLVGFVQKPFGPSELIDAIEAILTKHGKPVPPGVEALRTRARMPREVQTGPSGIRA
jgi:CheY-like chemotaxis protein